jgi:YD repeat-containing protein
VNDLDGMGRIVATRIDLDGDGQFEQTVNRDYDGAGRLVEIREVDRTLRFLRDREGRVVTREIEARGRIVTRIAITYDDRGRVVRESGDLEDVRYVYDQAGCLSREQHYRPEGEVPHIDLEARCDAGGRRVSRRGIDGSGHVHETWRYDEHGRVVEEQTTRDGSVVLTTRVTHDAKGRRIAEEYRDGQGTLTGRRAWSYAGDDVVSDQIDNVIEGSWVRTTYTYDDSRRCSSG